jgi:hypothetical protein
MTDQEKIQTLAYGFGKIHADVLTLIDVCKGYQSHDSLFKDGVVEKLISINKEITLVIEKVFYNNEK